MGRRQPILQGLGVLLLPWPALCLGMLGLRLAEWWAAPPGADAALLGQMLLVDARLIAWALPVSVVLFWPLLKLPGPWLGRVLLLLGGGWLLVSAALNHYFSVAGVPLGAELWAYRWQDIRTTVAGAQLHLPGGLLLALLSGLLVLWWSLQAVDRSRAVTTRRAWPTVALGLSLAGIAGFSAHSATTGATPTALVHNKLAYWIADHWDRAGNKPQASENRPYPFEHAEATPDTLGPFFNLQANTPPHLVLVIVEGLGRSFSGPDARLGSFTPYLDTLAEGSLYWSNFLAAQGRTFAVLPSVLGSLPYGPYGAEGRRIVHDSLPGLLKAQGYHLRYFSGSSLEFDQQGAFLASLGFEQMFSERDFRPPAQRVSEWGYPDGELLDAVLARPPSESLSGSLKSAPTLTVVQTMSMHSPFRVPAQDVWRSRVSRRLQALGVPPGQQAAYLAQQDIYASILYTDDAIRRFVQTLSTRPEWRNTVLVITGDHRLPEIPMQTHLERYHVPLIVHSPLLRQPQRIRSLSSHWDIAPAVLALLAHRYNWSTPQRVHWMGAGLDAHPLWRNVHALPLQQTRTSLQDYISGEYALLQDQLYTLQDGLVIAPDDNPDMARSLRQELASLKARLQVLTQAERLVERRDPVPLVAYDAVDRSLEPEVRVHRIRGVVVTQTQVQRLTDGRLQAQGLFSQQGAQASPVFVPLLVLTDALGRQIAEVSGPALQLQAGQTQSVSLMLPNRALDEGPHFVSLLVSHPDTGKPLGKGQYHVPLAP